MPVEKFWANVDQSAGPDACWPWLAGRFWNGYGKYGKSTASRFAYEDTYGPLPVGHEACHTCDNPPCCNPTHLFAGTRKDNMQDAKRKGRMVPPPLVVGEAHYKARATPEQVRMIRKLVTSGQLRQGRVGRPPAGSSFKSIKQVSTETGLAWATVRQIAVRGTWKHLEA